MIVALALLFQRMIANTVKTLRYCRSQPFSKLAPLHAVSSQHSPTQSNAHVCVPPQGPDSPQAGKNHSDVRAYVRQFNVIDNQRTLTQLSHGLEPPRSWKPFRERRIKCSWCRTAWRTFPTARSDHMEDPVGGSDTSLTRGPFYCCHLWYFNNSSCSNWKLNLSHPVSSGNTMRRLDIPHIQFVLYLLYQTMLIILRSEETIYLNIYFDFSM